MKVARQSPSRKARGSSIVPPKSRVGYDQWHPEILAIATRPVLFSLVSSCQRHGHDPFVYLRDVLTRLPDHPKERLVELLPDGWTPPEPTDATAGMAGPDVAEPVT
jgi:hypothetical protein